MLGLGGGVREASQLKDREEPPPGQTKIPVKDFSCDMSGVYGP